MTERWRKKLDAIDDVGPSDDVYARAKAGPSLPEPQSPMRRTSTRVVTAIAAFVVFALAISVFAIPALRLGNKGSFVPGGGQLQPLWPWNSINAVQAWRDDPQSIGATSVDHFSSPDEVAAAFGRDVIGWTEVFPHEESSSQTYPCPGPTPGYTNMSPPPTIINACSVVYGGGSVPPTIALYGSTTTAPAFRTFDLSTCPPNAVCGSDYGAPQPRIKVVVYQPLGGEGPWAVLEAKTDYVSISLDPGTQLRDGSTAYASGLIPTGEHAVLGYHATADGCGEHSDTTAFEQVGTDAASDQTSGGVSLGSYSRGQLQFTLPPQSDACSDQLGYVFVAITDHELASTDPLGGIPLTTGVLGFAAVPVSFDFLSEQMGSPPPSISSATPSPVSAPGHSYTDPRGWTIDVPDTWTIKHEANDRIRFIGDGLAVEISYLGASDSDDSSLPLDPTSFLTQGEGGLVGSLRGNGSEYGFVVFKDDGGSMSIAQLSDAQAAILDQMIASITFPGSTLGAGQDGWTAIAPALESRPAEWIIDKLTGEHYLASLTGKGTRVLFGPAPRCAGGGGSYEVHETGAAAIACPDGTYGDWDSTTGEPQPDSSAGFDIPLTAHDAVLSWDGWLLARLGPMPSPTG